MILLTINMNMFDFVIDDSFTSYISMINPDIAFIQECRYNRISKGSALWAFEDTGYIDSRIHISAAILNKDSDIIRRRDINVDNRYSNKCVFVTCKNKNFTGIHLPLVDNYSQDNSDYKDLLKKLEDSNSDVICGDFNATPDNLNYKFIKELCSSDYENLWDIGLKKNKAFYINFSGVEITANKENHKKLRTFVKNTHIDYILAKKNLVELNRITIDFRTLAFTDHCSIICDFEFYK